MLNILIDKLSGNDLTLNQLAEHLDLTNAQNIDGNIRFKIYNTDGVIFDGLIEDCLLNKLLKKYGADEVDRVSLNFDNFSIDAYIEIELN